MAISTMKNAFAKRIMQILTDLGRLNFVFIFLKGRSDPDSETIIFSNSEIYLQENHSQSLQ